jgi:hypothetical protein
LVLVGGDPKSEFRGDQFTRMRYCSREVGQANLLGNRPNINEETLGTMAFSRNDGPAQRVFPLLGITHRKGFQRMANNQNDQNNQSGKNNPQKRQDQPQSGQQAGQQQRQGGQQDKNKDNQSGQSGQHGSGQQNK